MAFDTLSDRLRIVANGSLTKCRGEWGGNGLKMEAPIASQIGWQPTFFLKPRNTLIVAVEVNELIFPELLKIAAHDVEHSDYPIAIYQACALDVFQSDARMTRVNMLRDHGFGLITVDDTGAGLIQFRAAPYAQHISQDKFDKAISSLNLKLKVQLREAYATYQTDPEQGLQQAAKIVEALISCICTQAETAGVIAAGTSRATAAAIVDVLYNNNTPQFSHHRAVWGAARSFLREYRNPPSHPAKSAKAAAEQFRKCKAGFFEALRMTAELRTVIQALGYKVIVH